MPIPRRMLAVLVCIPAMAVHGQQRQLASPVAAYVFDGAALRPISGVPGGATLGEALALGFAANAAVVSPRLDSAIVTAHDGSLHLFRLTGRLASEVAWPDAPHGPSLLVYSPSGTAVAIYALGKVQVVGGLPNAPSRAFAVDLALPAAQHQRPLDSAALTGIAVSDDAAWLLVAGYSRVRLLGASGSSSVLAEGARVASVAFAPGSHAGAVLNGSGPRLDVYQDVSAAPAQRIPAPELAEPAGLAFSADGKLMVAAAFRGKSVTIFDLAGGAASTLDCSCSPTGVSRMGSLFRLTDAGSGPVWLLDANVSPARISFVPMRANP